jgi:hypothetical protein
VNDRTSGEEGVCEREGERERDLRRRSSVFGILTSPFFHCSNWEEERFLGGQAQEQKQAQRAGRKETYLFFGTASSV